MIDAVPAVRDVVEAVVNDPYVVDDRANRFTPVQLFVSASSVDDAVLSVPVIVTGAPPITVKPEHDTEPEQLAVVVAVVDSSPPDPTNVRPLDSEVSLRLDENVDDAVENSPFSRPSVVVVEL